MSDEHHDEHGTGAHEVDQMPNARLFNLLVGLSALTLAACFGVVQLFNMQVESIAADRAKGGAYSRIEYQAEMSAVVAGYGETYVRDGDQETTLYHIPAAKAVEQILADPKKLRRGRSYAGWAQTPTAIAIGDVERQFASGRAPAPGQPGAAPTPVPVPIPVPVPPHAE